VSHIKAYVRNPVMIKAIQYTKASRDELLEVYNWCIFLKGKTLYVKSQTEGDVKLSFGDYLIDMNGEIYTCKKDLFPKLYREIYW